MSKIFTIGHSNQKASEFIALLVKYNIDVVVDVRSNPHSRFHHFNRDRLEVRLTREGIDYLYLGDRLGGHPRQDSLYLDDRVIYERIASLPKFRSGIKRVVEKSEQNRVALMCTEHDPEKCHRHPLLAWALQKHGVQVLHIRRDGSLRDADDIPHLVNPQLPLFEPPGEDRLWRSPKPIPGHGRRRGRMPESTSQSIRQSYSDTRTEMAIWLQSKLASGLPEGI